MGQISTFYPNPGPSQAEKFCKEEIRMRNLKRALSLTLASVMLLGMMVIGTSAAAGYDDVKETDNVEAIEVLQAVEVMVGDDRGFGPDRPVTRAEMAVVMGKLLNLDYNYYVSTCPFADVSGNYEWARGWVGACYANKILSGRGEGVFDPAATVTAVEAASMMMRALGYFQYAEDVADGFQLATVRQGNQIGIFNGVGTDATTPMTRNQVAQMALNALKANMVDFTGTLGIEVNGVKIGYQGEYTFRSGTDRKYFAISSQGNTTDGTTNQAYVQLGEELYDGDLRLNNSATDAFGRPARYWEYDGTAVGTYAKKELLKAEYTTEVTGKTLYDLLGKDTIDLINGGNSNTRYTLTVTIDGNENNDPKNFAKSDLTRTNTNGVGGTGNGVLTEVYVDNTARTVDIAVINTYLAIAENDYNEKKDEVSLKVYNLSKNSSLYSKDTDGTKDAETSLKANAEDFAIEDVKKDDKFLVTVANGELQSIAAPEVLSEQTISSHKVNKYVVSDKQYDYSSTAQYDVDVMEGFGSVDMKEVTYNIVLDKYGYLIGIEENEAADQYVFLTGIDDAYSHLSQKNVPVNIIHLDGSMETVTMNARKSTKFTFTPIEKASQANTWCTYSVDNDGVYTLTQVASVTSTNPKVKVAQSAQDANGGDIKINSKNISLNGDGTVIGKVHGNDNTVYINVDMANIDVSASSHKRIVDDVNSVTTGVTNVDLTVKNRTQAAEGAGTFDVADNEVYTLYKDNGTIIAVVTLEAEDNATNAHYAYISSNNIDHRDYDASAKEYSWYREAIVDGEFVMLKEVDDSTSSSYLNTTVMNRGKWYEIKYNADDEVRGITEITYAASQGTAPTGSMPNVGTKWMEDANFVANAIDKTFILQADYTATHPELKFEGGTLYTGNDTTKGVYVSPNAKVIVFTKNYDKSEEFSGSNMSGALSALNDKEHFNGYVNAVIGANGVANVVILDEKTASAVDTYSVSVTGNTNNMTYTITDGTTTVNNTSLSVDKGANVTVTFTASAGYVFAENDRTTLTQTLANVTANRTVSAPEVKRGAETIDLKIELGTGVSYIEIGGETYGDGATISKVKGSVLVIAAYDAAGDALEDDDTVIAQFQSSDSTDRINVAMNAANKFVLTLVENGTLYVTADGDDIAQMYFEDAKARIESRTFTLYYKVNEEAMLTKNAGIQYFENAMGQVDGKTWSTVNPYTEAEGNGVSYRYNKQVEAAALTEFLNTLTTAEGDGYTLDQTDTNSPIGITGDPQYWSEQVGPTQVGNKLQFTRKVAVFENDSGTLKPSNEIGQITVKYELVEIDGTPDDWKAPAAPDAANVKSDGTSATTATVTIEGNANWLAGKYRLYLIDANGEETSLAIYDLSTAGTTLTFTVSSGLATGNGQTFKLAYYGEIGGLRDRSELSDAITLDVSAAP